MSLLHWFAKNTSRKKYGMQITKLNTFKMVLYRLYMFYSSSSRSIVEYSNFAGIPGFAVNTRFVTSSLSVFYNCFQYFCDNMVAYSYITVLCCLAMLKANMLKEFIVYTDKKQCVNSCTLNSRVKIRIRPVKNTIFN